MCLLVRELKLVREVEGEKRVWGGGGYKLEVTVKTRANVFILLHLHLYRVIFKAFISS